MSQVVNPQRTHMVSLRVPAEIIAALDRLAHEKDVPRSVVIVDAVKIMLDMPDWRSNVFDEKTS